MAVLLRFSRLGGSVIVLPDPVCHWAWCRQL